MRRMTEGKFRHFPVIEEGQLVGIVSIGDVVKSRLEELEQESSALNEYIHRPDPGSRALLKSAAAPPILLDRRGGSSSTMVIANGGPAAMPAVLALLAILVAVWWPLP